MHTWECLFCSLLLLLYVGWANAHPSPKIPIKFDDERSVNPRDDADDDNDSSHYNILMLGNSYTRYNSLESIIQALFDESSDDGYTASTTALTRSGMRLDEHASSAQSPGNQWNTQLTTNRYDFVILQDQSQVPSFSENDALWIQSKDGAIALDSMIEDAGATTIFFLTWGYRNGDTRNAWRNPDYLTMQSNLEAGYRLYAEYITAARNHRRSYIAPVGLAYKTIYDEIIEDGGTPEDEGTLFYKLYSSDGSHPTSLGSYLSACVIYSTITGQSSLGMSDTLGFDNETRQKLQMAADLAVFDIFFDYGYPFQVSEPPAISDSPSVSIMPSISPSLAITSSRPSHSPSSMTSTTLPTSSTSQAPSVSSNPSSGPGFVSPSKQPSLSPSSDPSILHSPSPSESVQQPSISPSSEPSMIPSPSPTDSILQASYTPSSKPSPEPSYDPTLEPSPIRTTLPTLETTSPPTSTPTGQPTLSTTSGPTSTTLSPTTPPTRPPTPPPTITPSSSPFLSNMPTFAAPNSTESVLPSEVPSDSPSISSNTSAAPASTGIDRSGAPTPLPSAKKTNAPTATSPIQIPSAAPIMPPTDRPFPAQTLSAELDSSSVPGTIPRLGFLMHILIMLLITCLM